MDEEIEKIKNERKLTPRGEFEYLVYGIQGHRADRGGAVGGWSVMSFGMQLPGA